MLLMTEHEAPAIDNANQDEFGVDRGAGRIYRRRTLVDTSASALLFVDDGLVLDQNSSSCESSIGCSDLCHHGRTSRADGAHK